MINQYDIAYGIGVGAAAPYWLLVPSARRKVLAAYHNRMGNIPSRDLSKPAVMIHAVSLGEINSTRALIDSLRIARPDLHFVVSATTETGFARGRELYGSASDVTLIRFPLDFSSAVDRLLDALRPTVVVLLELEVWPNFIRRCAQRNVPVLLVNGRVSAGSFTRYRLARPILGGIFRGLARACVQDETYAIRFAELGVPRDRILVTGTMKFDTKKSTARTSSPPPSVLPPALNASGSAAPPAPARSKSCCKSLNACGNSSIISAWSSSPENPSDSTKSPV